ncbi:MAG: hypothetical protein DWQ01_17910 [Planctomycetota bacterium]|nr:MAG: hypothetical protein DWQ01_17910 [Planctomycetota bacterium]
MGRRKGAPSRGPPPEPATSTIQESKPQAMHKFIPLSVLFFAAPSALEAQEGQYGPRAEVLKSQVVPAKAGEEGPKRYQRNFDFDPASYRAKLVPAFAKAGGGSGPAVSYDVATGEETVIDLQRGGQPSSGYVVGRELADGVWESLNRSFGQLQKMEDQHFPWSTHARIFFTQSGQNYLCSGTLVDARTLITAGHCVHEGNGGNWSENVYVSPAWDGDDDAFGSANGVALSAFQSWIQGAFGRDMGWIRLDRPVGFLTGWLGYGYNDDDNFFLNNNFWMTGYPEDCFDGAPDQLYYANGNWDKADPWYLEADMGEGCKLDGMTGGGIYFVDVSYPPRFVYATIWKGRGLFGTTTEMQASRIDSEAFSLMYDTFIPEGYSTTQEDWVPMQAEVDMGGSVIYPGEAVTSFQYKLFNSSKFDPGLRTIATSVYLSTNDNISEYDTFLQSHTFAWNFGPMDGNTITVPPPTIPQGTLPGEYFLGVIVDTDDADPSNNDSDGWDAAGITVGQNVDAITLTGPAFADVGSTVIYNVADAPASSPAWMYWSRSNTGTTINGHPFEIGSPYGTVATGTTSSTGTWSVVGTVPPALSGVKIWLEVRVDSAGITYDSNTKTLRAN